MLDTASHDPVALGFAEKQPQACSLIIMGGGGDLAKRKLLPAAYNSRKHRLAEVLRQIESGTPVLPAARMQPRSGLLFWLCDAAAAQPRRSNDEGQTMQ